MEEEESLESSTLVSQFSDSLNDILDDVLAHSVETSSVVVSCILFAADHLLWMEKLTVFACADFVKDSWLKIQEYRTRDEFSLPCFRKERRKTVVCSSVSFVIDGAVLNTGPMGSM